MDRDSAYRIFTILNNRGLDLSYSDILKAEIIGDIEERQQKVYTDKWEDAEERVGREGYMEVLSHIRTIHQKSKLKETILKEIMDCVLPKYSSENFIDNIILPFTDAFDTIKTASYESEFRAEDVNSVLSWLCRIDNFDWMPSAMAYYSRHKHDPQSLLAFFIGLERLAATMMIRRENINYRLIRYSHLLEAIEEGQDLHSDQSPLQLDNAERATTISSLDGDIYHSGARIYILRRLDAELSETKTAPRLPIYTVEHVLPQHPPENSEWIEWFPDPSERDVLVHQIGNLALLSRRKNSQARNFEFDKKKRSYFNTPLTPFAITTQIIKQNVWTREVLKGQQERYLSMLKKLWRLE